MMGYERISLELFFTVSEIEWLQARVLRTIYK